MLTSRLSLLGLMVAGVARGELSIDPQFNEYWRAAPGALLDHLVDDQYLYGCYQIGRLPNLLARGALHIGALGYFPKDVPTYDDLVERYGPLIGPQLAFETMPFEAGENTYDLTLHNSWSPMNSDTLGAGNIGFAAAIRDLARAAFHPEEFLNELSIRTDEMPDESEKQLLAFVRSPRTAIVARAFEI
jgi:hypothetical protein